MTRLLRVRTGRALHLALGTTAALAAIVILRTAILQLPLSGVGTVAALVTFAGLTVLAVLAPRRLLSAGFVYGLMLCLFHLSIPILRTFGAAMPVRYSAYINSWFELSYATEAVYLSLLSFTALTTAFAWVQVFRQRTAEPGDEPAPPVAPHGFAWTGAGLVIAGVAGYLGVLGLHAPELLAGGTYRRYLDTVGGSAAIAGCTLLVAIGLCVASASGRSRARAVAWQAFGLFALITMSFGSRTAAMFAAVAGAVVVAATARRVPRTRIAVGIILGALLSITVVQQVRDTGVSSTTVTSVSINPVGSLAETGGTVRTVAEVVKWRRTYQEPPYKGITYAAPVLRLWERLTGQPRPEGFEDRRYAGVLLNQRVPEYQLGFSPVAEAFLNFGTIGVLLIFAAFGVLLGVFDARRLGHLGAARLGVCMYVLAYTVRNASNFVPITLAAGFLIIWLANRLVARPAASGSEPTDGRPGSAKSFVRKHELKPDLSRVA
ncbi:O-antigen polysaccharide polymerase Wzy [Actinoplanes sp. NPDC024001]|uniref:O-antigen polysaccharide polymerase Wzy n=1 Tax=Actinoplanes sp. NPDC024001 TaxID=3154598 RepID=UPI0033CD6806